ncbi:homocysteine S-methyltransferase family protein [Patulibacter defluvii]|uniref:homocysteine S-methyltransferase family protein n=1 Tax=Patulibacter defluvii TaxID=3095358 RepID=UPI002A7665F5|nr:homocysteine S-methyltransferase family protein [Patulibacter sp. DM4]
MSSPGASPPTPTGAYGRVTDALAGGRCVVLDGGVTTELPGGGDPDDRSWGVRSVVEDPAAVRRVHERYVEAGADVITTATWGLLPATSTPRALGNGPVHWLDVARSAVRLARDAASETGSAVAFSIGGDVEGDERAEEIDLLARAFLDEPPDLVLVETLTLVRPSLLAAVERLLALGLPVWLSFRRCRHGLCGAHGEHWGGPEGDAFGRAARQFERLGIEALLINCVPPDHVDGMVSYLRDFVDLPLGVYPNLGYPTGRGWHSSTGVSGEQYAELALRWREEGAQIIGGCCGVGPEHVAAAARRLTGVPAGRSRRTAGPGDAVATPPVDDPWRDGRGRPLYPLDFPDLVRHPGVYSPQGGSLLAWRHLFEQRIGVGQRCLDVGTGTGLLAVQLARNGAAHVHAIDRDPAAVRNAEENAHRNGVGELVSVSVSDLYRWRPEERYEVVVASLYQLPVDPFRAPPGHRPADYWGRNVLDELLDRLPDALASEGVAYVVQVSFLSREATVARLAERGLRARVAGYELYPFPEAFASSADQIRRVEDRSDAYHVRVGEQDLAVAYLLEIRWADDAHDGPPWDPGP